MSGTFTAKNLYISGNYTLARAQYVPAAEDVETGETPVLDYLVLMAGGLAENLRPVLNAAGTYGFGRLDAQFGDILLVLDLDTHYSLLTGDQVDLPATGTHILNALLAGELKGLVTPGELTAFLHFANGLRLS